MSACKRRGYLSKWEQEGRTQFNRTIRGLEKAHWLDAACVGLSTPAVLVTRFVRPLSIKATGHGTRQQCRTNASGFPVRHKPRAKQFQGWQTGDMVKAVVPSGKYAGTHVGRIAIRFRPMFRLNGVDAHPKYMSRVHRADGYSYQEGGIPPHA